MDWEMIVGLTGLVVVAFGALNWALATVTAYKVGDTKIRGDIKMLSEKIADLETDVRDLANANTRLSDNFHSETNKILHKLAGDNHE